MQETALMWAARNGNLETVKSLVSMGADPEKRDALGESAWLEWAQKNLSGVGVGGSPTEGGQHSGCKASISVPSNTG